MERRRRRQDDEVHDQIREEHPGHDVVSGLSQLGVRGALACFEGRLSLLPLFLDFLRGLPEEQVGRNGGAEDPNEGGPIGP